MDTLDPVDPKILWVGHYDLAPTSRIVVIDNNPNNEYKVYIYISALDAIRHEIGNIDRRNLLIVLHPNEFHDKKLERYKIQTQSNLKQQYREWDSPQIPVED